MVKRQTLYNVGSYNVTPQLDYPIKLRIS